LARVLECGGCILIVAETGLRLSDEQQQACRLGVVVLDRQIGTAEVADPEILDERVLLSRGRNERVWPWGLDESFSGLAFVGQHSKAGSDYSHISHTQNFRYIDLRIDGISVGEYGQLALCAMELGVPTFFAAGEQAFAEEAEALTPGVVTVAVKRGLNPDGLDDLDTDAYRKAKLGAVHSSPKHARVMIRAGALTAIKRLKNDPGSFRYAEFAPPYVRTARFRQYNDTPPYSARDEHSTSIIELMRLPYTRCGDA